jgi:hypothetical protein
LKLQNEIEKFETDIAEIEAKLEALEQ